VNHSGWESTLEPDEAGRWAVRMGWSLVKGLPQNAADVVVRVRESGPFGSYVDFTGRTGFSAAMLTRFAAADAFRSCGTTRRPALWQSLGMTMRQACSGRMGKNSPPLSRNYRRPRKSFRTI
jgi:error-prone DNA polymerase